MMPTHCREVAVKRVTFPLTAERIALEVSGKSVYTATNYVVLNKGGDWAVLRVTKAPAAGIFRPVTEVKIVSLPDDTSYIDAPDLDVQNASAMVTAAQESGVATLVVKGKYEHVSFVHKEKSQPLVVFDVVPPHPAKIAVLAEAALATGRIRKPIRIVPEIVDLNGAARRCRTSRVMFPCYASSLVSGRHDGPEGALYLDQAPRLDVPIADVSLIGCDVSRRIFSTIYGAPPGEFVDMCPKGRAQASPGLCLARCCMVNEGHRIEGNVAYLSWGASVGEVEEAIIDLFQLDIAEVSPEDFDALGDTLPGRTA